MPNWGLLTGIASAEKVRQHSIALAPETSPTVREANEKKFMKNGSIDWWSVKTKTRSTLGEKFDGKR